MREAYIKQIMILDEDGDEIAMLEHDTDVMYLLKPLPNKLITSDDMLFIAKVMKKLEDSQGEYYEE